MITTPTDSEVEAGALALWKDEQCKWVSPDYSQHQGALRNYAKVVLAAARAVEPNPNELPLELLHRNLKFSSMVYEEDDRLWFVTLCDDPDVRGCTPRYIVRYGPTPRAAFEAACAAAKPPS